MWHGHFLLDLLDLCIISSPSRSHQQSESEVFCIQKANIFGPCPEEVMEECGVCPPLDQTSAKFIGAPDDRDAAYNSDGHTGICCMCPSHAFTGSGCHMVDLYP